MVVQQLPSSQEEHSRRRVWAPLHFLLFIYYCIYYCIVLYCIGSGDGERSNWIAH